MASIKFKHKQNQNNIKNKPEYIQVGDVIIPVNKIVYIRIYNKNKANEEIKLFFGEPLFHDNYNAIYAKNKYESNYLYVNLTTSQYILITGMLNIKVI